MCLAEATDQMWQQHSMHEESVDCLITILKVDLAAIH